MLDASQVHRLRGAGAKLRLYAEALRRHLAGERLTADLARILPETPQRLSALADALDTIASGAPESPSPQCDACPVPAFERDTPILVVVEDDPDVRELTAVLLRELGWAVLEAPDGSVALSLLEVQPVDLILMDMRLPIVDGYELVQRLRTRTGVNQHTPIVGVSASVDPEDCARALACGVTEWCVKPLLIEQARSFARYLAE